MQDRNKPVNPVTAALEMATTALQAVTLLGAHQVSLEEAQIKHERAAFRAFSSEQKRTYVRERLADGTKQIPLADRLGVSQPTISRYSTGKD